MDTVLRINVASLNDTLVEDLKQQFGQAAELEIHVRNAPDSAAMLNENGFWDLIGLLDWSKADEDAIVEPLLEALSQMSVANIHQFADILSKQLWLLDTEAHALASRGGNDQKPLSVDYFLYDRCRVVAGGKDFFKKVLKTPSEWPVGASFESLLYAADEAYERKTGKQLVHIPAHNYETHSNQSGWSA